MKLKNVKTGEIIELLAKPSFVKLNDDYLQSEVNTFNSLAELNEEWEDYEEEPKEYWFIDYDGGIVPFNRNKETVPDKLMKQIGNYFETKEEAEKAVEKLEAWKRLKDKGFRFDKVSGWWIEFTLKSATSDEDFEQGQKDLYLLFGGEE